MRTKENTNFWNDDKIADLKVLWAAGHSAAVVARKIGCPSRSAVCGKVFRLGLSGRVSVEQRHQVKAGKLRVKALGAKPRTKKAAGRLTTQLWGAGPDVTQQPLPVMEEIYIAPEDRKGVLDLAAADCRWPIGDPRTPDFHFCAQPKFGGLSYCEAHARRAYVSARPPAPREHRVYAYRRSEDLLDTAVA